ncbi:MAG: radical SAM protein, partial [Rhodoferax sp.]|nr:radical SAM protein [Rhodoferax sp.]
LAQAGVPVAVFASPMVPAINDVELEKILQASAKAGATYASYVLLRLPLEVRDLFVQWLQQHFPLRAEHVMHRVQEMRGGKDYDANFATRMKGKGMFAELLAQRFQIALKRYGLQKLRTAGDVSQFKRPAASAQGHSAQARLF